MHWYVGRRLLQAIPVFLGATLLLYAMVFLRPGDPVSALGGEKGLTPAAEAAIREQYHLDEPFLAQYLYFLRGVFTFNLGKDFRGQEISDVIAGALPVTFQLAIMALVFEAVLGIAVGLWAGMRKGKLFDATALVVSLIVIAVPTFVIGFVLQFVVGLKLQLLPVSATDPTFRALLMPAIVLGATSFAYVLRLTRTSVSENLSADYVRTARARGLSRGQVTTRHVLRNSLIPVVTFLGGDLGALMGGAIVTEGIFNIHGVGGTLFDAITRGENVTVVSLTTVLVMIYILANLVVDLLYAALDPRIRYA